MPTDQTVALINEQIAKNSLHTSSTWRARSYFDDETLPQLAAFFYRQAMEERDHAMMLVQYLLDTDASWAIPGVAAPKTARSRTSSSRSPWRSSRRSASS